MQSCLDEDNEQQNDILGGRIEQEWKQFQEPEEEKDLKTMNGDQDLRAVIEQKVAEEFDVPWMEGVIIKNKPWVDFHNEVKAFYDYFGPNQKRDKERSHVFRKVKRLIKNEWPDAKVNIFGSCSTGLYLPFSDLDLIVVLENCTTDKSLVRKLASKFLNNTEQFDKIEVILNAKVPLVKCYDIESGLSIDVSFNKLNGLMAVSQIRKCLEMFPEAKYIILIFKMFLRERELHETFSGGIGSFLLTNLVVSYFQMQVRNFPEKWSSNLGYHLQKCFELYALKFNYEKLGISIKSGGFYYDKHTTYFSDHRKPNHLSVQNPQDEMVDIGRSAFKMQSIQKVFVSAYQNLLFSNARGSFLKRILSNEQPLENLR